MTRSKSVKKFYVSILVTLFILLLNSNLFAEDFKPALPGRIFSFPQDHFSHPEFKTEWWYYSGHLQTLDRDKRFYGYQLTFFRTALKREKNAASKWSVRDLYFAHLALTDKSKKNFEYREKVSRGSLGEAGALPYADHKLFRVWVEDWSVEGKGSAMQDHLLKARDKDFGIELTLTQEKRPVVHGKNGISQKGAGAGHASHYYSISRLETKGKIFLRGNEFPVQGISWMDHEFGSNQLGQDQVGWDWFSIQLDQGTDLMFYQIRHRDRRLDPFSSGTIIFADGSYEHLPLDTFQIDAQKKWKSRKSGAIYPSGWSVKIPGRQIELTLSPTAEDQELITQGSTRVTYWEGSVSIDGKYRGTPVKGMGYVELTGYAGPFRKGI